MLSVLGAFKVMSMQMGEFRMQKWKFEVMKSKMKIVVRGTPVSRVKCCELNVLTK